jgi:hypothetical protein
VTSITAAVIAASLTAGGIRGEEFTLFNDTGLLLSGTIPVGGTTSFIDLPAGYALKWVWTGTEWLCRGVSRADNTGLVIGAAKQVLNSGAIHIGYGGSSADVTFPLVFSNGSVLADYGVAFSQGTVRVKAARGQALATSICRWPGSLSTPSNTLGTLSYAASAYVIENHQNILFTGDTTGATLGNLTFTGTSTLSDTNTIVAADFNGVMFLDLLVNCQDYNATPLRWARMVRSLCLASDGTTMTIQGTVQTPSADVFDGAGFTPTLTIEVVSNRLSVRGAGVTGAQTEWVCVASARAGVFK